MSGAELEAVAAVEEVGPSTGVLAAGAAGAAGFLMFCPVSIAV